MTSGRSVLALATVCALVGASASSAGWEEGVAAFQAGNYAQAIVEFQQFVEERTDEEALQKGYRMLAQSLLRGGKAKEAVAAFQKHLELKPGDVGSQVGLGQAYYKSGQFPECVAILNKLSIGSLPKLHQILVYQMRSASLVRLGSIGSAAADQGRVAELKPTDAKVRFDYGALLHGDGQLDAAVAAYEQAISMEGGNVEWKKALVGALLGAGRSAEGFWAGTRIYSRAEDVAKSLVKSSRSYDNLLLLGEAQLGAGSYDAATSTFRQAIKLERSEWLPHFYVGQALTARERYKRAERPLETALGLASVADEKLVWSQLGYVFWCQGKYAKAAWAYENAGDFESVRRVRESERKAVDEYLDALDALKKPLPRPWNPAP